MEIVIRINQLASAYSRVSVLKGLTFDVKAGEFFIIIGPNGSGKTTLIRSLAGFLPIASGEIVLNGRSLKTYSQRELALELAYVAQTGGDDGPFTIRELVLMGRSPYLGILGVEGDKDVSIAREAIAFTGLDHLADRRIGRVSGGERQRAHISRAICQSTGIILLDEPTASLDLAHQIRIMDLMAMLKRDRGTTVVMVSHDLNLAAMYADRLLLLVDGRVAACGPPDQVIDEQILANAYGCRVLVDRSPTGPWRRVNLMRETGVQELVQE
jgi:iron complex transport system ATP-binding protein